MRRNLQVPTRPTEIHPPRRPDRWALWASHDIPFHRIPFHIETVPSMRRGLSLLEVIIALAVLTGTAAVLAQMVGLATRHAERARQITGAQTVAHNILHELLADLRPWETSNVFQPVDLWSPWDYQIRVDPVGVGDLVAVTVTVAERVESEATRAGDGSTDPRRVTSPRHYRLTRWVRHAPEIDTFGSATRSPRQDTMGPDPNEP